MKNIITTVGTSIFSNYMDKEKNKNIQPDVKENIKNIEDKPYKMYDDYKKSIDAIKKEILKWAEQKEDASAEIQSLKKIKEHYNDDISVYLIATDSILSPLASEIIKELLKNKQLDVIFNHQQDVIYGLQVGNSKIFEKEGMPNLIKKCDDIIKDGTTIINITGGFKATIPYLTIIGQINDIPLYYNFEETNELITIPQLPIDINFGIFERYSDVFFRLEEGIINNWSNYKRERNIWDELISCVWEDNSNDMAELNTMGKILWNRFKQVFLVYILENCEYFYEKEGDKKLIDRIIRELYKRLNDTLYSKVLTEKDDAVNEIFKLKDKDDLNHGGSINNQTFIFKSTKVNQIRLVYSFEYDIKGKEVKSITLYDYKKDNFDHTKYISEFKSKYKSLTKIENAKIIQFKKGE